MESYACFLDVENEYIDGVGSYDSVFVRKGRGVA